MEADMSAQQQDASVSAAYLGVRAFNSNGSWQVYMKDVPTVDGSNFRYQSEPFPTALAAAQQYDKLVIALLGRGFAAKGTNVNFAPGSYTAEDVSVAAQMLLTANDKVMLDRQCLQPAAAAAPATPAAKTAALGNQHPPGSVVYIRGSPDDDDCYDSALAAAAGAAIAARRAAAAAARAAAEQLIQQEQQQQQEEILRQHSFGEAGSQPMTGRNTRKRRRRSSATVQATPAAAAAADPDNTDNDNGSEKEYTDNSDLRDNVVLPIIPAAAADGELHLHTWLQHLVLCNYLFKPCQYCTGKRMERPSAGRDKLIRFFCPADPSRGYCNYCPELLLLSQSVISVGRAEQNSVRAHYIRMTDIQKLYGSSGSSSSDGSAVLSSLRVQAYPIGGHRVLFLRCRDPRKQLRNYKRGGKCVVDGRALKDTNCQYCSLTCKLVTEIPGFSKVLKHGARGGSRQVVKAEVKEDGDVYAGVDIAAAAAAAAAAAEKDDGQKDDDQEVEETAAAMEVEQEDDAVEEEQQGVNVDAVDDAAANHHQQQQQQQQQEEDGGEVHGNAASRDDHQWQQQQQPRGYADIFEDVRLRIQYVRQQHRQQQQQQPPHQQQYVDKTAAVPPVDQHVDPPPPAAASASAAVRMGSVAEDQQQQQQQQSGGIPGSSMHIVMPSGNQVQVVTDAQGNSLLLHIPTTAAETS